MSWIYTLNKEDDFMMRCKHIWLDEELVFYPERWDIKLDTYIITTAFSHCYTCGAERRKEIYAN